MSENNVFKMLLEGAQKTRAKKNTGNKLKSILNNEESMDYEKRKERQVSDDMFSDFDDFENISVGEERDKVDHLSDLEKISMKDLDKKSPKEQLKILKIEYNRLYDKLDSLNDSISNSDRLISDLQMERRTDEEEVRQMKNLIRKIVHLFPGNTELKAVVDRGFWKVEDVFGDIENIVLSLLTRVRETDFLIEQEVGKVRDENAILKEKVLQYKEYVSKIAEIEQMVMQQQAALQHQNIQHTSSPLPPQEETNSNTPQQISTIKEEIRISNEPILDETEDNVNVSEEIQIEQDIETKEELEQETPQHNPHFSDFFSEFTSSFNKMKDEEQKRTATPKEKVQPDKPSSTKPEPSVSPTPKKSIVPPPLAQKENNSKVSDTNSIGKHPLSPDYVEVEKEEIDDLFDDTIEAYLQNLSVQQEFLLTVIGKTGISRNSDLKDYLKEDALGQQYYFVGKRYNSSALNRDIAELRDKSILNDEQISYGGKGGGTFNVYELSKTGKSCYKKITSDNPVIPERKRIKDHHASLEHGYLIKDSAKIFREMGYKVYTDLEDVTFKIDPKHRKVFDFIVENDEGKLMHIEVERGTHTQEDFSYAMDKIYEITKDFYFICPNEQVKNKNTKKKFFTWVTKSLGGIQNADVTLNMLTIEQLRKKPKNLWEVTDLRNVK